MSSGSSHALAPGVFVYTVPSQTDRTTVVRLPSGGVWLHAPPVWSPSLDTFLAELGPIAHIVAVTADHTAQLADWSARHPAARCWTAAHLAESAIQAGIALPPTVPLSPDAEAAWDHAIALRIARGNAHQHAIFRHLPSGVLITGSLVETRHATQVPALVQATGRLTGRPPPLAHTPLPVQLHFLGQRRTLIETVQWATTPPPTAIVPLRGPIVMEDPHQVLSQALAWVGADGPIPPALRFALGANPGGAGAFFVAAALTGGLLLSLELPAPSPLARVVTAIVVADIVAGVVTMSLPSTRAWWRHRGPAWIAGMLGIHIVHPMALVAVNGGSGGWGAGLWLTALLGGGLVWLWPQRSTAGPLAMLCVGLGTLLFAGDASGPTWFAGLYLLKLVGCFAMGVRPDASGD